jgi:puromycin-sensitive aminopeptidase
VVDDWRPDWRVWLEFDLGKASALALDALRSTHPVHAPVRTVAEATEAFDLITYQKGGAVLRMLEGYLGRERFRDGIRRYMRRHARGNAVAADLWRALGEASGEPVLELAEAWIDSPGYPVVAVVLEGSTLRLAQRRFFSRPGDAEPAARWPVPVVLRYAVAGQAHERRLVLRGASETVALEGAPDWLVANAGATGFYRVALDAPLRDRLTGQLPALAPAERVGLLADEWALVRSGERSIDAWLTLALAFSGETDHAVLDELVARLDTIDHRVVAPEDRPRLAALVRERYGAAWQAAGWDAAAGEGDPDRLRRAALLRAVGLLGRDPAVVAEAAARLERFAGGDRPALEANLVDAAVTISARGGDAARWEQFRERFEGEVDPAWRRRWLLGLAAFEAPALVERSLGLLFGDGVPLQDWASFATGLFTNPAARGPAWARLQAEWPAVTSKLANAPMLWRRVIEATGLLTTRAELEVARAFYAAQPVEPVKAAVAQALERLAEDVDLAERARPVLGAWLRR